MDKDLRIRSLKKQIRMKELLIVFLSFACVSINAESLFQNCQTTSAAEVEHKKNIKSPRATYKKAPRYPYHALSRGIEGRVVLGFTVKQDGTISEVEVLARTDSVFVKNTKEAIMTWKYEPAIGLSGEPIDYKLRHTVKFELEGTGSNLFYLSEELDQVFAKSFFLNQDLSPKRAIKNINNKLKKDMLPIQKAMYLYLRATKTSQLKNKNIASEKADLEQTLSILDELDDLDPNVLSLKQFTVRTMSQIYKNTTKEILRVSGLLEDILLKMIDMSYPKEEQYQHYIDYGIASYNLSKWCESYESFDAAIKIEKMQKMIENPNLVKYRDLAKTNL